MEEKDDPKKEALIKVEDKTRTKIEHLKENKASKSGGIEAPAWAIHDQFIAVLGIAQDAGYPQAACKKSCCRTVLSHHTKMVSCLGIFDQSSEKYWLIDATPDIKYQFKRAEKYSDSGEGIPNGIFLTHAHIGHYTGLMHLGREAMGASKFPVYAMPKMRSFLESNGPWSQLVSLENIEIITLADQKKLQLSDKLSISPFLVPHRDEFSETVGYLIEGEKSALYIPDIDKWEKWNKDINEEIKKVDYAILDGTFYKNGEIWGRDMSQIPHPFITESMEKFKDLDEDEKDKIYFIHFNHTNPLIQTNSEEKTDLLLAGYKIASEGMILDL